MNLDSLLKQAGLTYEELTREERQTYNDWLSVLRKNALTIESVREYVKDMRFAVEKELTENPSKTNNKEDFFLKARLKNYMLLEAFLTAPMKAQKALERTLENTKIK